MIFLPEIENTQTFGSIIVSMESELEVFTFPYWSWSPIVERWLSIVERLGLMPVFDCAAMGRRKSYFTGS